MDGPHKVRPTLWSVSLFLTVPPLIVEAVNMVRCSLLHTLVRFLGRREVEVHAYFSCRRSRAGTTLLILTPFLKHSGPNAGLFHGQLRAYACAS
jgi:hypothetical protein